MSNGSQGAGPQAGQQGQGSGTTTSQGTTQGQGQTLGDQLYGQQGQQQGQQGQGASQSGTGDGQLLEGQRPGESLADYGRRMNSELSRARQDAGRYRTQLRQYTGTDDGQQGDGQGATQGATQGQQGDGQGQNTPLAQLQGQVAALQRDLTNERNARKGERTSAALVNALATAGAVAPQRARLLVDSADLTLAADGTPTPESVQAAIDALRADMPQLFTDVRGNGDGGAGNTGPGDPQDFNAAIRRRAGR